jgi:hypothetical protein
MSLRISFDGLGRIGRLGNQLWQIAAVLGIADRHGYPPALPSDWMYRSYFQIPDEFYTDDFSDVADITQTTSVDHMDPRARPYAQDYHLWWPIKDCILDWFQPTEKAIRNLQRAASWDDLMALSGPLVSVHVRRGDNVTEGTWKREFHAPRPASYFLEAIDMVQSVAKHNVVVFSDDLDWCRQNIPADLYFVGGSPYPKEGTPGWGTMTPTDYADLFAMMMCDYHVISNSTFAWWGAFLSRDIHPVYPWPWFGPALDYTDASLMFPDDWVRLDHGEL